jgi:hypothetical protein
MSIEWKYKIDLVDDAIFKMSTKYGIIIPDDLVKFLEEANGATPSKTKYMLKVDEKIFGAVLSFNPDEKEADSFETAMLMDFDKNIIPFGIDPFGNYICYNVDNGAIVFFDHEEDSMIAIADSLKDFINMLYE